MTIRITIQGDGRVDECAQAIKAALAQANFEVLKGREYEATVGDKLASVILEVKSTA